MGSRTPLSLRKAAEKPGIRIEERLADEARFLKTWIDRPRLTGAVSPSGRFLARMMARYVDPQAKGPIVELGPGTGPITEALLKRGVKPSRLILVEFDPAFCKLLARRFPGCRVVQADAYKLGESLRGIVTAPLSAVVSSLPLLTKPEAERLALLEDAFSLLAPNGRFVQFTYGMASPMPRAPEGCTFEAEVSPPVWLNLPPARVWVYWPASAHITMPEIKPTVPFFDKLKTGTEKVQLDLKREIVAAKRRFKASFALRGLDGHKPNPALVRKSAGPDKRRHP